MTLAARKVHPDETYAGGRGDNGGSSHVLKFQGVARVLSARRIGAFPAFNASRRRGNS